MSGTGKAGGILQVVSGDGIPR